MAVGDTAILDNLNRANGAIGANYGVLNSFGTGLNVTSNQASGTGGPQASYWLSTFGPDMEVYGTIAVPTGANQNVDMMLGITTPAGAWNGYGCEMTKLAGTDTVVIYRADLGVITVLGATINQEFSAGDKLLLNRIGTSISVYQNVGSGWNLLGSRTDATYGTVGNIAWFLDDTTGRLDDLGGGTAIPGSPAGARRSNIYAQPMIRGPV